MARQAIRKEGEKGEQEFSRILGANARESDSQKKGDRRVSLDGEWHYIEIKQCESNTINQVRAIKCIPLVVFSPDRKPKRWAVLSPSDVVREVIDKKRGQHTEIPFECANLSRDKLPAESWCRDEDLAKQVMSALRDPRKASLQKIMDALLKDIQSIRKQYRAMLREALE